MQSNKFVSAAITAAQIQIEVLSLLYYNQCLFGNLNKLIDRDQTAYFVKNVSCSHDPLRVNFTLSHTTTCFGDENEKHRGK